MFVIYNKQSWERHQIPKLKWHTISFFNNENFTNLSGGWEKTNLWFVKPKYKKVKGFMSSWREKKNVFTFYFAKEMYFFFIFFLYLKRISRRHHFPNTATTNSQMCFSWEHIHFMCKGGDYILVAIDYANTVFQK